MTRPFKKKLGLLINLCKNKNIFSLTSAVDWEQMWTIPNLA